MISETNGGIVYQVLMTILINIPLISFGMTVGWLSPNALVLQKQGVSDEDISWMASITFLSGIPSVFLYWYVVDVLGRKIALLCTSLPFAICWLLTLYSSKPWALITARAIAGLGSTGSFIVPPLYVKEISQDSIRGALGSVMVLGQNLGYLIVFIISDRMSYNAVLWTCFVIPALHFLVFLFVPESPSFDLSKGRVERATKTLAWLRQRSIADPALLQELKTLQLDEHNGEGSSFYTTIVSDKATFKAFTISIIAVLAQEVCGLFTLVMFSGKIFETAGSLGLTANQKVIILGCVQLAGSVVASCFVEKIGRKPLLTASSYTISTCMTTLGAWFYLHTHQVPVPGWLPTTVMCVAIFSDSAGLQPVPYVIMSEMFKFELRGLVTTVVMGLADLANFVELKVFHTIVLNLGMYSCFWIFAGISFCYATFILLAVPETMGKSVDEIAEELRNRNGLFFKKKKKSKKRAVGINNEIKENTKYSGNSIGIVRNNDHKLLYNSHNDKYIDSEGKIITYNKLDLADKNNPSGNINVLDAEGDEVFVVTKL